MIIKGVGPKDAKIAIIGEAPGHDEERKGIPFIGSAGKLLDRMLVEAGIEREECFIDNVMQARPPGNDFGNFYKDSRRREPTDVLITGRKRLYYDLRQIKPNIIIGLGNEPLKALAGREGITNWRGSTLWIEPLKTKVLCTYHPAGILRNWIWRQIAVFDLKRALEQSKFPEYHTKTRNLVSNPENVEAIRRWTELILAKEAKYQSFDIETYKNKVISCIAFATSDRQSWCFPILHANGQPYWESVGEETEVWKCIHKILRSSIRKIAQNANFDITVLNRFNVPVNNLWMDTMNAHHLCASGNTLINTLHGDIKIKDLVREKEVWLWSCNVEGEPVPAKATNIRLTQHNVELLRVHFWKRGAPGEGLLFDYIDVTPDHRFRMLDGSWCEADLLVPSESLTPLHTYYSAGRQFIKIGKKARLASTYIAEHLGITGDIIHHKDKNPLNDDPPNLRGVTRSQHNYLHDVCWKKDLPPWNKGKSKLDNYNVQMLYDGGLSCKDIAELAGVNISTVVYYMQRKDIPRRNLAQAQQLRRHGHTNAKVLYVEQLDKKEDVYNMEVDRFHCFAANKVFVHNCYPEYPKKLAFQTSLYTDQPFYKHMRTEGDLYEYCCLDAVITYEVAMALKKEMEELNVYRFYRRNIHPLITPLRKIQGIGVLIDEKVRTKRSEQAGRKIKNMQEQLEQAIGHPLNVNSHKQMVEFLYKELKLPARTKMGRLTADEDAIKSLRAKTKYKFLNLILEIRGLRKLKSVTLDSEIDKDGRVRTTYLVDGTEMGRISSRKTIDKTGMNLQNVPKPSRDFFVADKGCYFIGADLMQADDRIVAYLSNDVLKIKIYAEGKDPHAENAVNIYGVPLDKVTPEQRFIGKKLVHAANYGIGYKKFSLETGLDFGEAREALNRYYATYPGIKLWHAKVEAQLRKTRSLTNPFGRRRIFFNRLNDDLFREGYAFIPASTVADCLNMGLVSLYHALPVEVPTFDECKILLQIHDAIVVQVPDINWYKEHMNIKALIKKCMEIPIVVNGHKITIPVDIKEGRNWKEVS